MSADATSPPVDHIRAPAPRLAHRARRVSSFWRRTPTAWVLAGSVVAIAVRLPYLRAPLGSDEGGFLLVASQWRAGGTSLYGDYWVDRPPLLIAFFAAADRLGGPVMLRLVGCALALSIVVLAHLLGREVARHGSPLATVSPWPVLAATAFVSMPLTGAQAVNGELIALPLVLLGLLTALRADRDRNPSLRLLLWAAAGSLGVAAAMVKQNFLDVLVFSVVLLIATAWTRRHSDRSRGRAMGELAVLLAGGLLTGAVVLLAAWSRGTSPGGLWDALVVFRLDAGAVIAASATSATQDRLVRLLVVLCLSGGTVLIGSFAAHASRRARQPVVMATMALLGWELLGVLGGGSYWLHYLLGLIPGLVLAVGQLSHGQGRLGVTARAAVVYAALVALVTVPGALIYSPPAASDPPAAVWLKQHARPGDTATVLYGSPNVLRAAGLASPYPQLWSLPVRVRDPNLAELQTVLDGQDPPTWLLASRDLATWGVSAAAAAAADAAVTARYEPVDSVDGYTVYRLRVAVTATRDLSAATSPTADRLVGGLGPVRSRAPTSRAPAPQIPYALAQETP